MASKGKHIREKIKESETLKIDEGKLAKNTHLDSKIAKVSMCPRCQSYINL